MWTNDHSTCVFFINNIMCMQPKCVYHKRCNLHLGLDSVIAIIGSFDISAHGKFLYVQNSYMEFGFRFT